MWACLFVGIGSQVIAVLTSSVRRLGFVRVAVAVFFVTVSMPTQGVGSGISFLNMI